MTDSPILLSSFYGEKYDTTSPVLNQLIFQEFYKFNNINFLLKRTVPFDTFGRMESEEQSDQDHRNLTNFLNKNYVRYTDILEAEKTTQIIKILNNLGCINV